MPPRRKPAKNSTDLGEVIYPASSSSDPHPASISKEPLPEKSVGDSFTVAASRPKRVTAKTPVVEQVVEDVQVEFDEEVNSGGASEYSPSASVAESSSEEEEMAVTTPNNRRPRGVKDTPIIPTSAKKPRKLLNFDYELHERKIKYLLTTTYDLLLPDHNCMTCLMESRAFFLNLNQREDHNHKVIFFYFY